MDGSERHQSDVREIIRRQKSKLDFDAGRIRADQKCRGTRVIVKEKRETEIAMETEAGRQGLAVWWRAQDQMTGEQRLLKALELTETSRQVMRDGIRQQNPHASEAEIQELYVDRLLSFHGLSLDEIRHRQATN